MQAYKYPSLTFACKAWLTGVICMDSDVLSKTPSAVYLRRSQDRQDRQVLSVDGQLKKARMLVSEFKLKPTYMPAEERTASKPGRPIFNQMMDLVNTGKVRYIVCWKANRLARNPTDAGKIIQAMDDGKLLAVITDRGIYHNNARDKHNLWEELGDSKKFSDDLSKDVLDGYERKYERGEYPREAFTGYTNVKYDKFNKNIAPCPDNSTKVKEVASMAMTGRYQLDDLYKHAVLIGLRTPRGNVISKTGVQDMLQRKAYTGVFWHGGAWRQGSYDALLTQDEYDKIQIGMGWREKRSIRQVHKHNYAYKVMQCGGCGYSVTAYPRPKTLKNGNEVQYNYYVCSRKSKAIKCIEPQVTETTVEQQAFDYMSKISLSPEESAACLELVKHFDKEDTKPISSVSYWLERKKQADKAIDEFSDLLGEGVLTRERYDRLTEKHFKVLEQAESKTSAHTTNTARQLELTNKFFTGVVNILDTFKQADISEKREMLIEVGSNWILSNKKVLFTPRKPYDFLANRTSLVPSDTSWRARPDLNRRSPP